MVGLRLSVVVFGRKSLIIAGEKSEVLISMIKNMGTSYQRRGGSAKAPNIK